MVLTYKTFLIVCPLVFLAGLVDAIGGGGGFISIPAYLIAGLPPHAAIATNKFSSSCGTTLATSRFIKNGLVNFRLAVPGAAAVAVGAAIGANISLRIDEKILSGIMTVVLPLCAFVVLNKKLFNDSGSDEIVLNRKTYFAVCLTSFAVGIYDGFYGPGTGTFLIIAFTAWAKLSVRTANAQAKFINLASNLASLTVFIINGEVIWPLALAAAACNMLGGYAGAGLVMKNGTKIVKPVIIFVLILFVLKMLGLY
ncbi:MAG: sulfite exporter TauE/SafE family protein [Candidatus Limivicinus sp.]|jgi:uncharacterized membrane protein YfcA